MHSAKELSQHVKPALDEARIDRQWAGVLRLSKARPLPWKPVGFAVLAAAACAGAALFVALREGPSSAVALEGSVVETSGASAQRLTLADGSRVEIAEGSRITFANARADRVHLLLSQGSMALDVTHKPEREFTVSAGDFDVIVRGTRFRVTLGAGEGGRLNVSVDEGRVEARRRGGNEPGRFVGAGESWTSAPASAPPPGAPAEPPAAAPPGAAPNAPPEAPTAPPSEGAAALPAASSTPGQEARRLLEVADAARLGGRAREAAEALDKLRRTYRSDPRAGLAALELGRLRMDSFGNARGALEAFEDAAVLAPSGSVREDADARKVQALEALGDLARCARARDAYLARFPGGIHAPAVRGRCVTK